jgi:hypothetical protein
MIVTIGMELAQSRNGAGGEGLEGLGGEGLEVQGVRDLRGALMHGE